MGEVDTHVMTRRLHVQTPPAGKGASIHYVAWSLHGFESWLDTAIIHVITAVESTWIPMVFSAWDFIYHSNALVTWVIAVCHLKLGQRTLKLWNDCNGSRSRRRLDWERNSANTEGSLVRWMMPSSCFFGNQLRYFSNVCGKNTCKRR